MTDAPNSDQPSAFADMTLRIQHLTAQVPNAEQWRWMLFDHDLATGKRFGRGSVGPVVTLGLPWVSRECSLRWIGLRYFFWPHGIPTHRRVSVVSSTLKRRLDMEIWWFDLLRTAILGIDPDSEVLCAVKGTAPHRYVCRAAELFGRSVLEFHIEPDQKSVDHVSIATWIADVARQGAWNSSIAVTESDLIAEPLAAENYEAGRRWLVYVSPQLMSVDTSRSLERTTAQNDLSHLPIADRILFTVGQRLQILQVRSSGAIQALLTQHVLDNERSESLVMLASNAAGQIPAIRPDAANCVVPWLLKSSEHKERSNDMEQPPAEDRSKARDSLPESTPFSHPADWLLHWTRPTIGPWPDQDEQDFNDELILGCRTSDRSALSTLLRIVTEGHLWASSETIRGRFSVVSFTAVPLFEFRRRRKYRRHRCRYDFEPWGIAVRRDILESSGAREVTYGDDETWQTTPETDRPFYQNIGTGDGWTKDEQEWRIVGHLHLKELPDSAVAVFVDTNTAQTIVQSQSPWRVFVVPE